MISPMKEIIPFIKNAVEIGCAILGAASIAISLRFIHLELNDQYIGSASIWLFSSTRQPRVALSP